MPTTRGINEGVSVGGSPVLLQKTNTGYPSSDTADRTEAPSQHASQAAKTTWYKKTYYKIALWFRRTFMLSKEGKKNTQGTSGVPGSVFNQIKYSDEKNSKELYLGMIPDQKAPDGKVGIYPQIPGGWEDHGVGTVSEKRPAFRAVSIMQRWEADHMNPGMLKETTLVESEDNVGMRPGEISEGVEALHRALSDGSDPRPVYLHCKSGVGRSATVLAAYLMKYHGMTLEGAIERVQRDRPDAQLRRSTWFGLRSGDTKHTEALRVWKKKQDDEKTKQDFDESQTVLKSLQSLVGVSQETQIPLEDRNVIINITQAGQAKNFKEFLNSKTEPQAMTLMAQIAAALQEQQVQQVTSFCTRMIQRRFCGHRQFHEDTVGTGLADIPAQSGYGKQEAEGRRWHDPGWPAMWQHAGWKPGSTLTNATRVLALRDPIMGKTELGEVKLNLNEVGTFSAEESKAVMVALAKGARGISNGRDPKITIENTLGINLIKKQPRLSHVLESFLRACDAKITELNQKLQNRAV